MVVIGHHPILGGGRHAMNPVQQDLKHRLHLNDTFAAAGVVRAPLSPPRPAAPPSKPPTHHPPSLPHPLCVHTPPPPLFAHT